MKIETFRDKIVIPEEEVQALLKAYILEQTNRLVDGSVNFSCAPGSTQRCTVYAHLKDEK